MNWPTALVLIVFLICATVMILGVAATRSAPKKPKPTPDETGERLWPRQ